MKTLKTYNQLFEKWSYEQKRYHDDKLIYLTSNYEYTYVDNDLVYIVVNDEHNPIFIEEGHKDGHSLIDDIYEYHEEGVKGTFYLKKKIDCCEYETLYTSTYVKDNFFELIKKAEKMKTIKKFKI